MRLHKIDEEKEQVQEATANIKSRLRLDIKKRYFKGLNVSLKETESAVSSEIME